MKPKSTLRKNSPSSGGGVAAVQRSQRMLHTIFLAPSVVLIVGMLGYPIFSVLMYSFQKRHILDRHGAWVGLSNYQNILGEPLFWKTLSTSIVWTLGTMVISAAVGLVVSLLLHAQFPFRNLARGFVLVPYIVPTVVVVLVFRYMFNDMYGIVNHFLEWVGLSRQTWLASPDTAMNALVLIGAWKFFPFFIIALLGRLQMIPTDQYEAARVDGANYMQSFYYITWPAILPIFLLTLLLRVIWTFNNFDLVYLLTQGGPLESTTTLPILLYQKAFGEYNLGYSSTLAVCMIFILLLVSAGYFILQERVKRIYD